MQYKASSTTETKFPETNTMAAPAPIAIGTRGTVGSLVRKEIEYFSKLELDRPLGSSSSRKPQGQIVDMTSSSCTHSSKPSFWFLIMTWKRKKRRSSRRFLSSICSATKVAETNRLNGIPGFNYRILKDDMNNLSI